MDITATNPQRISQKDSQTCSSDSEVIARLTSSATAGMYLLVGAQVRSITVHEASGIVQLNSPELHLVVFQLREHADRTPLSRHEIWVPKSNVTCYLMVTGWTFERCTTFRYLEQDKCLTHISICVQLVNVRGPIFKGI